MGVWMPGPGATAGDDTFTGDNTAETADGLGGNDTLIGNDGDDTLSGGAGSDFINGGRGADILDGGDGHDTFVQVADPSAVDAISGGPGNDFIDYTSASEGVVVQLSGYATASGSLIATFTSIEQARGTPFDDALIGTADNNTLWALTGEDWLVGAGGNDTFVLEDDGDVDHVFGGTTSGDSGNDQIIYSFASQGVVVQLAGWATDSAGALIALLSGIEQAVGSDFDDALIGDAANNTLFGNDGADWLVGGAGDDILQEIADAGNVDRLFGGTPSADAGVDTIDYSLESAGVVVQLSGWATDAAGASIATFSGIENARGGSGDDALIGTAGANVLTGGAGADWLVGGGGDDVFMQNFLDVDRIFGGTAGADSGFDTISYALHSGGVIVQLSGYATTNDAARTLLATFHGIEAAVGTASADALIGNAGNNHLTGGEGADWLAGQVGADRFIYPSLTAGIDTIADFSRVEGDRIDLSPIDANQALPGDQAFTFSTMRTSGLAGQVVATALSQTATELAVYLDSDNNADMRITIIHEAMAMSEIDLVL